MDKNSSYCWETSYSETLDRGLKGTELFLCKCFKIWFLIWKVKTCTDSRKGSRDSYNSWTAVENMMILHSGLIEPKGNWKTKTVLGFKFHPWPTPFHLLDLQYLQLLIHKPKNCWLPYSVTLTNITTLVLSKCDQVRAGPP